MGSTGVRSPPDPSSIRSPVGRCTADIYRIVQTSDNGVSSLNEGIEMTSERPTHPRLTTRIVYEDLPDLVEIETHVWASNWQGVARAYASPQSLHHEAKALEQWCRKPEGEAVLEAGADTGIGWVRLRFYPIDMAGHLVCHVQLATAGSMGGRPEEVWRMSLEIRTEPGLVERYARQLAGIVDSVGEEVLLQGVLR